MASRAGKQDTGLGHAEFEMPVRLHREVKGERGGDWSWGSKFAISDQHAF